MQDATGLAVKDINDKGGVRGRKLKLVSYDTQSANEKYTQLANHLAMLVEQNLAFASQLATRPYLLDKGRTVQELPTNGILNDKDPQLEHSASSLIRVKEEITVTERTEVSEATVRTIADLAGLPLAEGREALLAPQLSDWLTAANELNRKMSEPEYQTIMPATVFTHPNAQEENE